MPAHKIVLCSLLLVISLLFFYTTPALADAPTPAPVSAQNYKAPQNANYTLENLQHSLLCELAGTSPLGQCLAPTKNNNNQIVLMLYDQVPNMGAIGSLTNTMVALYAPPTSTIQYLAGLKEEFNPVKTAYAQVPGSGSAVVTPILGLWQAVRNISYLGFILIFLAVGFMVMFRTKINPQTVISVQQAIPGLVIGLILVTFSYFIAALIIDLSFVGTRLVAEVFIQSALPNYFGDSISGTSQANKDRIRQFADSSDVFQLFSSSALRFANIKDTYDVVYRTLNTSPGTQAATVAISTSIGGVIGSIVPVIGTIGGGLIGGAIGFGAGTQIISGVISTIVPLILIIALFVQFFRLLFGLIGTYISLLISTITGPFVILLSSVPGQSGKLSGWLKSLLANSLVFPAVFAAFLFAGAILASNNWSSHLPLFGALNPGVLKVVLAYGVLMGTPAIPDLIKKAFGVKGMPEIGQAALAGAGAGFAVGRSGVGRMLSPYAAERKAYGELVTKQHVTQPIGPGAGGPTLNPDWWTRIFQRGP